MIDKSDSNQNNNRRAETLGVRKMVEPERNKGWKKTPPRGRLSTNKARVKRYNEPKVEKKIASAKVGPVK